MTKKTIYPVFFICLLFTNFSFSQMKIGASTAPAAASVLELESTTQGFVLPRVSLTSTASNSPLGTTILTSTMVYNTNAAITGGSGTGLYYWDGSKWNFLANSNSLNSYWSTSGNSGTTSPTNFVGTTDNNGISFKTNNTWRMSIDSLGSVAIGTTAFDPINREKFLVDCGTTTSDNMATFQGSIGNYLQLGIQNQSNSINASTDFVATADNGTDSTNYIDMGINSSTYNPGVENFGGPNDGYLYVDANRLLIGTQSASDILFLQGGGFIKSNQTMRLSASTGNMIIGKDENQSGVSPVGNTIRGPNAGASSPSNSGGGSLTLQGGSAVGTGTGGAVNINGGIPASGTNGAVNINTTVNGATNINTGTSTGNVSIGNSADNILFPGFSAIGGVFYTSATTGQIASTGAGTSGYVLQANGAGAAPTWVPATTATATANWQVLGNSGITTPAVPATYGTSTFGSTENWIGNIDAKDFTLGTSNKERMRILSTGNVGIGTAAPGATLDVNGYNVSTGNTLNITANSLTTGTGLNVVSTGTITGVGEVAQFTGNSATTGNILTLSGTGLTTGSVISATAGTTTGSAVSLTANGVTSGNGINLSANGLTTGTGLNVTSTGTITSGGQLAQLTGNSATTGNILTVSGTGLTTGSAIGATAATTTGNAVNIIANGLTTGTGLNVTSTGTITGAGEVAQFTGNSATTGNILTLSGTGLTTGSVISATAGTTTGNAENLAYNGITTGNGINLSANGLTSGNGLNIASTSTAGTGSGSSALINLSRSGANANASHTAYGIYGTVTNTGTTGTNIAAQLSASGATNNYSLIVPPGGGYVGLGTATPNRQLVVMHNGTNNVVTIENTNVAGYSSIDMYDNNGTLASTFGYGNSGSAAPFTSRGYFNAYGNDFVWMNSVVGATIPVLLVSGQSGTPGYIGVQTISPQQLLELGTSTGTIRIDGLKSGNTFNSSSTAATSTLLYSNNSTGDVYSLPTVNNATLVTSPTGVPSWSTAATNTAYIFNQTTLQSSSNFNISGNGTIGTNLSVGGTSTLTGALTSNGGHTNSGILSTTGGAVNLNASSNYATNINTGTSTGTVTIGGASNLINLPGLTASKGVFTDASKNLTTTGTLSVSQGGTGLTTLTANNVMLGNGTSSPAFVAPGTSGNVLYSNGTTWISSPLSTLIGVGTYAYVTGSNATNSTTTLTDITGLSLAMVANATYEFEGVLGVNAGNTTKGINYAVNYTGTISTVAGLISGTYDYNANGHVVMERITALNTAPSPEFYMAVASTDGGVLIKGFVTTTSAGNFSLRHAVVGPTASGYTSTVYTGSYLKITRIQ